MKLLTYLYVNQSKRMDTFYKWLNQYGRYWEQKDVSNFITLFSENARYYWTPFSDGLTGREKIFEEVTRALSTQSEINFEFNVLSFDGITGVAHWNAEITRTITGRRFSIDGIIKAEFDTEGLCIEFREWWHSNEND